MPNTFKTEDIKRRFSLLPEAIKDIILDENDPEVILGIFKKNGLRVDRLDDFFTTVKAGSVGLIPYDKFGDELASRMEVGAEIAKNIARDIDEAIFSRIRKAMSESSGRTNAMPVPPLPPVPPPPPEASKSPSLYSTPLQNFAPKRPPMSPFVNAGNIGARFEPVKKSIGDDTATIGVPKYAPVEIPHIARKQEFEKKPEQAPAGTPKLPDTTESQNIPPSAPSANLESVVPPPPKPFAQSMPPAPIEPINKTLPPGREVLSVPKPVPPAFNPNRIGKEILPQKTANAGLKDAINKALGEMPSVAVAPKNVPIPIPKPPTDLSQRGKFGQGSAPQPQGFGQIRPQGASVMPRENAPTQVSGLAIVPPGQNPKTSSVIKSSVEKREYTVDPYREPAE